MPPLSSPTLHSRSAILVSPNTVRAVEWMARVALGAAFLSAVASRFGLWSGIPTAEAFEGFVARTAEVVAFAPHAVARPLAWAATAAETILGLLLLSGLWSRPVALSAGALLTTFGLSMLLSLGIKAPLDASVFSAAACAFLLALRPR